ncbi:MAG: molybdenum cofactor guanylyltransferase [Betaproteobacteria bacterium]|nr:MAG: molybdenum cofactor guanylyltransferase [Betaproteobacteria bacterium]
MNADRIKDSVTGLILAGGQGRRMGNVDKGLELFRGKRLVDHVYERLAPQVGGIIINANQNHDAYKTFGVRVVSDAIGNFAGPLAGLHAGLSVSRRPYLASVPCDSPFLPEDLVERLLARLNESGAELAVAKTGDQPHPVFCLARRGVLEHLSNFLKGGGRKIDAWYASLAMVEVNFDDRAEAFSNINTREELANLEEGTSEDGNTEAETTAETGTHAAPAIAAAAAAALERLSPPSGDSPAGVTSGDALARVVSCIEAYDPNALRVEKAREVIRSLLVPVATNEKLAVRAALGRVLGEPIISTLDVPAHDNAAMDGYALRHADLKAAGETELRLAGSAFAGRAFAGKLGRRECVRIMTGAVMPQGADTVVIQEIVQTEGDKVRIPAGQKRGQNRRLAGEDLAAGKAVLEAGQAVGPAELGLIASLGLAEVTVRRRLRVAFFSTGDELASVGSTLKPGEVYDSNRYTLYGMLSRLGCDLIDMGVVRDDQASLERALKAAAADADAIITSGGVSVGEADFIRELLGKLGEVVFWKIAMKPGRPMAFGKIAHAGNEAHFFGLPGNPVAVMVTFYQFVREALLALSGRTDDCTLPLLQAPCACSVKKSPGRTEFQRGLLARDERGQWSVAPTGAQGSGVLRSMAQANCFIVLEHERGSVKPGELVRVQLFDGLI